MRPETLKSEWKTMRAEMESQWQQFLDSNGGKFIKCLSVHNQLSIREVWMHGFACGGEYEQSRIE